MSATPNATATKPQPLPASAIADWSLPLGRVFGVPVRLHGTLLALLAVSLILTLHGGASAVNSLVITIGLFVCVALHEVGHSIVAAWYGIPVKGIVLHIAGGVAQMTEQAAPAQDFWISLAGPMVNGVAAALLAGMIVSHHGFLTFHPFKPSKTNVVDALFQANVSLAVFNMIPGLPLDGGRVLRAGLAMGGVPTATATTIAARLGQALAILGGLWSVFIGHQYLLACLALYIYFQAWMVAKIETTLVKANAVMAQCEATMAQIKAQQASATLATATTEIRQGRIEQTT